MDSRHPPYVEHEAQRVQANRQELVERIARAIPDDGRVEPLNGLYLNREYKSLFGLPPMRDVERLREAAGTSTLHEAARGQ